MKCPTCGAEFTPKNSNQKYCSRACYHKAYEAAHREQRREYYRARYAAHKEGGEQMKCATCGAEFSQYKSGHKYCSRKCWRKAYEAANREKRLEYYRARYASHREEQRQYRQSHREQKRKYYQEHREEILWKSKVRQIKGTSK